MKYGKLRIYSPKPEVKLRACRIYEKVLEKCNKIELLQEKNILQFLYKYGLLTDEDTKALDILPKHIEYFHKDMYNNHASPKKEDIRKYLNHARSEYNKVLTKRHAWDYITSEGVANFAKWQYIIEHSTYYKGKKYNWEESNVYVALNYYYDNFLPDNKIREVAHTSPFDTMWNASRNVFGKPAIKLTLEQQKLIGWAKLYDSIFKASEPPTKSVIEDDDVLDGWLIIQREKREQSERENTINNLIGNSKIANADEVFIMADKMDPKDVYECNNPIAKQIIKSRLKQINETGEVKEQHLRDVQQKVGMQYTELMRSQYGRL